MGTGEYLGYARVHFDERDIVSDWLPLPSHNTRDVKHWVPVGVHSQVACEMDENCEQGVITMVIWSAGDRPPDWASENTAGVLYPDGTEIYYDWEQKKLTANAPESEINITCKKLNVKGEVAINGKTAIKGDASIDGETTVTGEVTAGAGSPKQTKVTTHTHTTNVGPSGPPIPG
ncbi:MAG: phage baseplate assembly protein V [Alistipes sp.]|nr:phage baseplate assembly protein V [Alistipes sp.]